jgi:O-antigen/teichoic acid export membrane protein
MDEDALTKIGEGSAIVIIGFGLATFFQYLYKMILARFLGPDSFGVFTQGLAIIQAATILALLGLNTSIPHFMSYYKGKGDNIDSRIFSTSLAVTTVSSLFLTALTFFLSEWMALQIFHEPALVTPLKIFSLAILPTALISFLVALFQGHQRAREKVIIEDLIGAGSLPALILAAILLGHGLNHVVIAYLAASVITVIYGSYLYVREFDHGLTSNLITRKLLVFSWPLFLIAVFSTLNRWFDVLMLGWLGKSSTAGIYDINFSIASYIGFLVEIVAFMFLPVISELNGQRSIERIKEIYTTATRWMITLSLPILAGAIIFTEELITLLFGANYLPGATALTVLALGFFYKVAKGPSEAMLISMGEPKKYLLGAGATTFLIAALNLLLIPQYGMLGAAVSTLAAFLVGDTILLLLTWREVGELPYNARFARVIPPIAISSGAVYTIKTILNPELFGSIVLGGLMGLIYVTLLYGFKGIQEEDLDLAREIYQRQL